MGRMKPLTTVIAVLWSDVFLACAGLKNGQIVLPKNWLVNRETR
jgi:hypothetical protein